MSNPVSHMQMIRDLTNHPGSSFNLIRLPEPRDLDGREQWYELTVLGLKNMIYSLGETREQAIERAWDLYGKC